MAALCCTAAMPAAADVTPAGTSIVNVAGLTFGPADARTAITSNSVALRVDAVLDVSIVPRVSQVTVDGAATSIPVVFVVTNLGNGTERFTLDADAGAAITIVADADGDGAYDPAKDRATDITLAAGESGTVFAILPGPVTGVARVSASATATTGHGAPGTVVPASAPGGIDAVVGQTGAAATAQADVVATDPAAPSLVKSQAVRAPDGSARAVRGAIVTYQLEARFTAAAPAAVLTDDVPAGTRFVPGSITLDGAPLTDADDGDDGGFDGRTVRVALGDIATAGAIRTIRFQTTIN
ncbi:hypothetical protein [Sphingomonas sp. RS2018]